jgi:8-oxo-dGTP pyrophosphatase MutT (NUDIX family)
MREVSAGGVVVRRMRGRAWLAGIEPQGKPGVRALPKGLVHRGEEPLATALREVAEETGVSAEPIESLGSVRYVYTRSGRRIFKVVSFYLMRYCGGRLGEIAPAMRREVAGCYWIPLEEAPRALAYRGERDMTSAALDRLRPPV